MEKTPKKDGRRFFFSTSPDPMSKEPDEEYQYLLRPRKVHNMSNWEVTQDAIYWINLRQAQDKGLQFWQTRSHAVILYDSVPTDCIEKVVSTKTGVILHQRIPTPRSLPKIVLTDSWQVQRDDQSQRHTGIGKPIADEESIKIDLRVQGVPHKAAVEDEDRTRRIWKLAHILHRKP